MLLFNQKRSSDAGGHQTAGYFPEYRQVVFKAGAGIAFSAAAVVVYNGERNVRQSDRPSRFNPYDLRNLVKTSTLPVNPIVRAKKTLRGS